MIYILTFVTVVTKLALQKDKERALRHQLRRELELWQYYSIISHQLNSYTPPLTGKV
jgi:hypothetical protein